MIIIGYFKNKIKECTYLMLISDNLESTVQKLIFNYLDLYVVNVVFCLKINCQKLQFALYKLKPD